MRKIIIKIPAKDKCYSIISSAVLLAVLILAWKRELAAGALFALIVSNWTACIHLPMLLGIWFIR